MVILVSFILLVTPTAIGQISSNAKTILRLMAQKYSRLETYQDDGVVITTYDEETGGRIEKLPFKTSFKRPNSESTRG